MKLRRFVFITTMDPRCPLLARSSRFLLCAQLCAALLASPSRDRHRHHAGQINKSILYKYFTSMGWLSFTILILSLIGMQATNILLLNYYSYAGEHPPTTHTFLLISAVLVGINMLFTVLRSWLFAFCGLAASRALYNNLSQSILFADISVLEALSIGQLGNRIGRDINTIDDSLPFILNILLAQCVLLIGGLAVIVYNSPFILAYLLVVGYFYYRLQAFYRNSSRELRRLDSICKSPIYTFYLESLTNKLFLHTLAPHMQRHFTNMLANKLNVSLRIVLASSIAGNYFSIRIQCLSLSLTVVLSLLLVCNSEYSLLPMSSAMSGLALLYSNTIINNLNGFVNALTETEQEFIAVERVLEYTCLTPDPSIDTFNVVVAAPSAATSSTARKKGYSAVPLEDVDLEDGTRSLLDSDALSPLHTAYFSTSGLRIEHLSMHYGNHVDILKDISLTIPPGSRVALIGRTGCGKTSFLRCLLRLNAFNGRILLGDTDITTVSNLRQKVCVIPQKCILFEGTVFSNVSVHGASMEFVVHTLQTNSSLLALLLAHFNTSSAIELLEVKVSSPTNLSAGQGQLISLLRAMLTCSDLIVIDELSAAFDNLTIACIYDVLRVYCDRRPQSVLIMICHKLQDVETLCNKVLKLEDGRVVSFEGIDDQETL